MKLRIRQVDGAKKQDLLNRLHDECFGDSAPLIETHYGHHWVVYDNSDPVGFACLVQSTLAPDVGYLKRAGILAKYRGRGLQRKLIKVREAQARRNGWTQMITDTAFHNVQSSNNLIRAGYRLFEPGWRWGLTTGLYWVKDL